MDLLLSHNWMNFEQRSEKNAIYQDQSHGMKMRFIKNFQSQKTIKVGVSVFIKLDQSQRRNLLKLIVELFTIRGWNVKKSMSNVTKLVSKIFCFSKFLSLRLDETEKLLTKKKRIFELETHINLLWTRKLPNGKIIQSQIYLQISANWILRRQITSALNIQLALSKRLFQFCGFVWHFGWSPSRNARVWLYFNVWINDRWFAHC